MTELIGMTLGQYRILEKIGHGGMGTVYKGYDTALDRYVAIKVLAPHLVWEQGLVDRFLREARTAAHLKHPHIVTIYNVGKQDGIYYFVMEYLPGRTLAEVIRQEGALPLQRVARIAEQIASALDYAHAQGLVHRDVKPGNILIGPGDQATLTDFGIVKALTGTSLTRTGIFIGTPEYVSPEQARGQDVDPRSDIYSLGVVCYEMLTGRVPFVGDTLAVLHAHGYDPPPPLRSLNPWAPAALEPVIGQALAKDPAQRYGTAGELVAALKAALAGQGVAEPPAVAVPTPRPAPARRRVQPWPWALAGLAVVAILVGLLLALSGEGGGRPTPTLPAPVAAVTATPTGTSIPGSTDTAEPTSTPTFTPPPTDTPTTTNTPEPTSTPIPPPARPEPTG